MHTQAMMLDNVIPFPTHMVTQKQFTPPTLEQVLLHGSKIGLPQIECEKLFWHFESNGWKVGGKAKMKSWTAAMMSWKLRCQSTQSSQINSGATVVIMGKEYDRVCDRMKTIKCTYGDAQTWTDGDKKEFIRLRDRKRELQKMLGIVV